MDLINMGANSIESIMTQKAKELSESKRMVLDQIKKYSLNREALLVKAVDKTQMRLDLLEFEIEGFLYRLLPGSRYKTELMEGGVHT